MEQLQLYAVLEGPSLVLIFTYSLSLLKRMGLLVKKDNFQRYYIQLTFT